jgi:cytochrome c-type biogenesis protein CcmH/NrfG
LKLEPHNPESKYYLGLIQYEKGHLKPALDLFRDSLKFSADKALRYKTLIQITKIYLKEKSPVLAQEYVEEGHQFIAPPRRSLLLPGNCL